MTIRIVHNALGTLHFTATASGHALPVNMPPPQGEGPDPHDYFDAALGGCKALTLMVYAQQANIPLSSIDVQIDRDNSQERQGTYGLKATLTLHGDLTEEQVERLSSVADRCPIHKLMTKSTIEISTVVEAAD